MVRTDSDRKRLRDDASICGSQGKKIREALDKSFANMGSRAINPYNMYCSNYTEERDFSNTPYVPVYVMLPSWLLINMECELVDPDDRLWSQLKKLKSVNVDGVTVDIWWGIVEADNPQQYKWRGYKQLFRTLLALDLKIQVVMSFHECRSDGVRIPLPKWIIEIGKENPDIYFTDIHGNRNPECLTWGIDEEPVLRGRTAVRVYSDFMSSFRTEFDDFFEDDSITEIQIGLGACGELRYPSCSANHGPRYSCIGEFQCYDKYLKKCFENAAKGDSSCGKPPDNQETGDFHDDADYDSKYGSFFLNWYSQYLIEHADRVLSMAKLVFEEPGYLSVKVSGMHWWAETYKHAQLTAGFYDGYAPLASMLNGHEASLNFTCVELSTLQLVEIPDTERLVWEVLNDAWNALVRIGSEYANPCYDRQGYNKILELAKPRNVPSRRRRLNAFTYHRLDQALIKRDNLKEFQQFVKRMHGAVADEEQWIDI